MGSCICIESKKQTIYKNCIKNQNVIRLNYKKQHIDSITIINKVDYFKKISKINWVIILNFLKFNDLKQASKVNR